MSPNPAEQAVERAREEEKLTQEYGGPDFPTLMRILELFHKAEELTPEQKRVLEKTVEKASVFCFAWMGKDHTFTEQAIFAYETLLGEGKFSYDEVALDKILISAMLYFRRTEQLEEQAKKIPKGDAKSLYEKASKYYKLGGLHAQISLGRMLLRGEISDFSQLGIIFERLQETYPSFDALITEYVRGRLQFYFNVQRIGSTHRWS